MTISDKEGKSCFRAKLLLLLSLEGQNGRRETSKHIRRLRYLQGHDAASSGVREGMIFGNASEWERHEKKGNGGKARIHVILFLVTNNFPGDAADPETNAILCLFPYVDVDACVWESAVLSVLRAFYAGVLTLLPHCSFHRCYTLLFATMCAFKHVLSTNVFIHNALLLFPVLFCSSLLLERRSQAGEKRHLFTS